MSEKKKEKYNTFMPDGWMPWEEMKTHTFNQRVQSRIIVAEYINGIKCPPDITFKIAKEIYEELNTYFEGGLPCDELEKYKK